METIIGIEMTKAEKKHWDNRISQVTPVNKCEAEIDYQAIVEGLLYVVGEEGLKIEQIAISIEQDLQTCEELLVKISDKYSNNQYGIELVNYASIYKFVTKDAIFPYASRLFQNIKPQTLSQSALETLAIIAYKQPVTRIEIEELRGVSSEMMLKRLINRQLIKEAGRSEAPGRPILYEVTDEFMDAFKLYTLNELPELPNYESQEENLFDNYD